MTIKGMFKLVDFDPIPIEEVEPWTEIVKRFELEPCPMDQLVKKHMKI